MITNVVSLLAYVDPGTGALIFQVLIAGVLAGLTFFTNVFQRIGRGFSWILRRLGLKRAEPEGSAPPPNAP
jgi:hypothetical protein